MRTDLPLLRVGGGRGGESIVELGSLVVEEFVCEYFVVWNTVLFIIRLPFNSKDIRILFY